MLKRELVILNQVPEAEDTVSKESRTNGEIWSLLGFAAAILFGALSIYVGFFYQRKPELILEIVSSAPVFSVNDNVPELEVVLGGENLRQSEKTLTVINARFLNKGSSPIKTADFDEKFPLQILVDNGQILRVDADHPTPYEAEIFKAVKKGNATITLPSFILEPGDGLGVKILVLHADAQTPEIRVGGKVAGIDSLRTQKLEEEGDQVPVFRADLRTHFLRSAFYLALISIASLIFSTGSKIAKNSLARRQAADAEARLRAAISMQRVHMTPEDYEIVSSALYSVIEMLQALPVTMGKNINEKEMLIYAMREMGGRLANMRSNEEKASMGAERRSILEEHIKSTVHRAWHL